MIPLYYKTVELLINGKIKLDPSIYDRLTDLDGVTVDVVFESGLPSFGLCIKHHGILVSDVLTEADVCLTATTGAFIKMAASNIVGAGVHISGDAGLGRKVERLLTDLDLDFTAKLSEYVGADAAAYVASGAESICNIKSSLCQQLRRQCSDYMENEYAEVVMRDEFKPWSDQVQHTKAAVDAVALKAKRLMGGDI